MPDVMQNTEVKERIDKILERFKEKFNNNQKDIPQQFMTNFNRFFLDLENLGQYTDELYQKNEEGKYPDYTIEEHIQLLKYYQLAQVQLGKVQESLKTIPESGKLLENLLNETKQLLDKDVTTLTHVRPEQGRSLAEAIDHGRCICVEVGDKQLSTVGNVSNTRYAMAIDLDGKETKGFFTKSRELKGLDGALLKSFVNVIIEEDVKNKTEYYETLQKYKPLFMEAMESLDSTTPREFDVAFENKMKELAGKYKLNEESAIGLSDLIYGKLAGGLYEPINGLSSKDYLDNFNMESKQYRTIIDAQEHTDISGRNVAMSKMASLMGMPEIVAQSKPMEIINAKGEIEKGIFMENAKGKDRNKINGNDIKGWKKESIQASYKNKDLIKSIANMQILDYVCGNVDRHQQNIFYQFSEDGSQLIGFQGIDNDFSFGRRIPQNKMADLYFELQLQDLKVIPEELSQKLDMMDESMIKLTLRDTGLTEGEMAAAVQRMNQVKEAISNKSITVVKDDEWKNYDIKKLAGDPLKNRNHFTTVGEQIDQMEDIVRENAKKEEKRKEKQQEGEVKRPFSFQKVEVLDPLDNRFMDISLKQQKKQENRMAASQKDIWGWGSSEFRRMRKAGKKYHDAVEAYKVNHSKENYEKIQTMLDSMTKNAQEYLKKKNPNTTNEKTKIRIDIAKSVLKFADKQKKMLENAAQRHEKMEKQQVSIR